jgi:hypothetical protein
VHLLVLNEFLTLSQCKNLAECTFLTQVSTVLGCTVLHSTRPVSMQPGRQYIQHHKP